LEQDNPTVLELGYFVTD